MATKKLRKGTYYAKDSPAARKAIAKLNQEGIKMAQQSRKKEARARLIIQKIREQRILEEGED